MKKREKKVLLIISLSAISCISLAFSISLFSHISPTAANDDFEINFTSSLNKINKTKETGHNTEEVISEKGNNFIIDYENVVALDSYWQKVNSNGYFCFDFKDVDNENKIHGLKNVVFNFDEPNKDFKIYFSSNGDFYDNWFKSFVTVKGGQTIDLSEGHPNYLKFVADNNDINIINFTISYDCNASQDNSWQIEHGVQPTIVKDAEEKPVSVIYGLYPQKHIEVPEEGLIEAGSGKANKEYFWYNDEYYVKDTGNPDTEGTPTFSTGVKIESGTTYYFKCEPIKWNVVSTNGYYKIDCSNILFAKEFDGFSNTYKNSQLRKWLKEEFFNKAFFLNPSLIIPTKLDDEKVEEDSVWTGSKGEYEEWYASDKSRQKKACDFALCNKAQQYTNTLYKGNCWYWTRTSGDDTSYVYKVKVDGKLGSYRFNSDNTGVSPCLTFSPS